MQSFIFKYGGWIIGVLFLVLFSVYGQPRGLAEILFYALIIAYFVLYWKRSQHETNGTLQFSSEEDPAVVFIRKALRNGDYETFSNALTKLLGKPDVDTARATTIIKTLVGVAPQGVKALVEKGDITHGREIIANFLVDGFDISQSKEILELQPIIKGVLKKYLMHTVSDPVIQGRFDKDGLRDIVAVLAIKKSFSIPDTFFDEPEVFPLVCRKVATEINRYYSYKISERLWTSLNVEKIPQIPENIIKSDTVQRAIEKNLTAFIRESEVEKAKDFAQLFHYKELSKLIENS